MGARLMSQVFTHWSHLPDRPFRLLLYMALVAKDNTPEPTFWQGRDSLAEIALGVKCDENGYRVARRAVADLVKAGAIERKYVGHIGKRSEYRIHASPNPGKGGRQSPPRVEVEGDATVPHKGDTSVRKGGQIRSSRGTPESPLGTKRKTEERQLGHNSSSEVCSPGEHGRVEPLNFKSARAILRDLPDGGEALKMRAPLDVAGHDARTIWAAEQVLGEEAS